MTWIDFVIIGVVLLSAVIGAWRGLVKEALSTVGWIASFIIAWRFNGGMAGLLQGFITSPNLQFLIGFIILFVVSMLIFALLIFFASKLVQRTGLTGTDRSLGVVFGVVRGVVIAVALLALAGLTTLPRSDSWRDSMLAVRLQPVAVWLTGFLPEAMAKNFVFK